MPPTAKPGQLWHTRTTTPAPAAAHNRFPQLQPPAARCRPTANQPTQLDPTNIGGITNSTYKWWEEQELRDLCEAVGLVKFQRERSMRFIMFSVQKPQPAAPLDSAEFEE